MFGLGRRKTDTVLDGLAPVVDGTVDRDGHLRGTTGGRHVDVWFERLDPTPLTTALDSANPVYVDVIRFRLAATGATPWYLRSERQLRPGGGHAYEFVRQPAAAALRRFSPFPDLVPTEDPAVEARLRQAGLFEAISRLAPASSLWLPRVRFTPDPRAAMRERMRGVPVPADVAAGPRDSGAEVGLMIDTPRPDLAGPATERFAAMLTAAIGIAELNERVNPAA